VDDTGGYVRLLEYNNLQGMILAANTTRKRVKNVKKLLRVGTLDYMSVAKVEMKEEGKCYIDLSKKIVQVQEVEEKKKFYDKAKIVHLILRLTAHTLKCKQLKLYEDFGWDLYDKFNHAYDAFKLCLT